VAARPNHISAVADVPPPGPFWHEAELPIMEASETNGEWLGLSLWLGVVLFLLDIVVMVMVGL